MESRCRRGDSQAVEIVETRRLLLAKYGSRSLGDASEKTTYTDISEYTLESLMRKLEKLP